MDSDPQNTPQPQFNAPEPVTPIEPVSVVLPEQVIPPAYTSEPAPIQPPKKSKKKLIIILIIIAILLIGGGVVWAILIMPKTATITPSTNKSTNTVPTTKGGTANSELPATHKDGLIGISFNAPNYTQTNNGASKIFTTDGYFIIFCRGGEKSTVPLEDINDFNLKVFGYSISREYTFGEPESILMTSAVETEVNGINAYRFFGNIHYKDSYTNIESDGYIMGYTFYAKGIPVQLMGVLNDEEKINDQATKDAIVKDIDAMMQTVKMSA